MSRAPSTPDLSIEITRTRPDFVVFAPPSLDRATSQTGNEHFLVERLPNGRLFAVWTQSSFEGASDQHIVVSRSNNDGVSWSPPRTVAGEDGNMASWAFPIITRTGRIYLFYSRHTGVNDLFTHTTGRMACRVSDDSGASWSTETLLPMPQSIWDNPDPAVPANWVVWQKPIRLADGTPFVGFTRWISPKVQPAPVPDWWASPSVVEFIRFDNIEENPAPDHLKLTFLAGGNDAVAVPLRGHPGYSVAQEPSLLLLPDGRLFCIIRTTQGTPYYTTSQDQGAHWQPPEPLRQHDDGPLLLQPLSPCPIYPMSEDANNGEYAFFYHNHDGHFLHWGPEDTSHHRRPICLARGQYRPGAKQPVWFSQPWFLFDHGGVSLLRSDLAMYASTTFSPEGITFWYPDRKFFLLGKSIPQDELHSLVVKDLE